MKRLRTLLSKQSAEAPVHRAMRVDNVPLWLKPAFHAYGYGVGSLFQASTQLIRHTCRYTLPARAINDAARIECIWHEHLPAYIATYLPGSPGVEYAWMNHPVWYMRPVHVALYWNGVRELALGSTGHGGRDALAQVVTRLGAGFRTTMAVDGPTGPIRVAKRGALDMALASGCPLVAVRFRYARSVRAPGWDHKWFPLPGSEITIEESAPMHVSNETYDACREQLVAALG